MPSDWRPYVLGADLRAKTIRDRHGDIRQIDVEANYAERRYFTEAEYENQPKYMKHRLDHLHDDEDPSGEYEYVERGRGASATVRYTRDEDGRLRATTFNDVATGDDDGTGLAVLRLLFSANMAVANLPDVDAENVVPPRQVVDDHVDRGTDVEIVE